MSVVTGVYRHHLRPLVNVNILSKKTFEHLPVNVHIFHRRVMKFISWPQSQWGTTGTHFVLAELNKLIDRINKKILETNSSGIR